MLIRVASIFTFTLLLSCLPFNYQKPPTPEELLPRTPTPEPKIGIEIPNIEVQRNETSACEIEVESLKQELRDWEGFYYEKECECDYD